MKWNSVKKKPTKGQFVIVIQDPRRTATRHTLFAEFDGKKYLSPGATIDGIHLSVAHWSDIIRWAPMPPVPKHLLPKTKKNGRRHRS